MISSQQLQPLTGKPQSATAFFSSTRRIRSTAIRQPGAAQAERRTKTRTILLIAVCSIACLSNLASVSTSNAQSPRGQQGPYAVYPEAKPPYYRVRYAAKETGKLIYPVNYTIWIPEEVEQLRGVIVHQHGCGEGSCRSGLTGAFDLHWQALAQHHQCALLSPAYEQPQNADCQMWCDPRNGSAIAFHQSLRDLGKLSGHPELASVPWALWGHSGGGHWAGGMVMMFPERVAAAWLRSGVPLLRPNPDRPDIKPHALTDNALHVPVMCNPGTKEGVTVKDGRFAKVWPANEVFFRAVRGRGGLIGVAIDPLTAHECGNQRYLAIRWLDACLAQRLPTENGEPLRSMSLDTAWYADPTGTLANPAGQVSKPKHTNDRPSLTTQSWLPDEAMAKLWMQYVKDTQVADGTPPPKPEALEIRNGVLSWDCQADLESGLRQFIITRNGEEIGRVPRAPGNRFGRPLFQGLQYSDTPVQPLTEMVFALPSEVAGEAATKQTATKQAAAGDTISVTAVNTVGLSSAPTTITIP